MSTKSTTQSQGLIPPVHPLRSRPPCSYQGLYHLVLDCTARSLTYRAQAVALGAAPPCMPPPPPPRWAWWSAPVGGQL